MFTFSSRFCVTQMKEKESPKRKERRDIIALFKEGKKSSCKQCRSTAQERRESEREAEGEGDAQRKKREYKGGKSSGKEGGEGKWRMHL